MSKRKKLQRSPSLCFRAFTVPRAEGGGSDSAKRGVLTTEQPVDMVDWERWEIVPEVLLMSGMKARGKTLKLVDTHNTSSVRNVLGSFTDLKVKDADDRVSYRYMDGVPEVSSVHEDIATKLREGHINEMSIGYDVEETVHVPEGEKQLVQGVEYTGPVNIRTKWTAHEASLVPLGADDQAQIRGYANLEEAFAKNKEPLAESPKLI